VTREIQFVLECARPTPEPARIRELLRQPLDWDAVLLAAQTHDLSALLYWRLKDEPVPPAALAAWRAAFQRNCDRNLRLLRELIQAAQALERCGIPVLVLKGPVLATMLYGHAGLRECVDLDLLVRWRSVAPARRTLCAMGYRTIPQANDRLERTFARYNGQMALRSEDRDATVDLHWRLAPANLGIRFQVDPSAGRLRQVAIGGATLRTLNVEDTLLLTAIHGGKHGWTTLAWVVDLAAMIDASPPDWDRVWNTAKAARAGRMLLVALALAHDLLAAPLPAEMAARIRADPHVLHLAAVFRAQLTGEERGPQVFARSLVFPLQLIESFPGKVRFLALRLLEPTELDWETWKMPQWLYPAYRVMRPVRLLLKYGGAAIRRRSPSSSAQPPQTPNQEPGSGVSARKA
jgi:hypothetical protein